MVDSAIVYRHVLSRAVLDLPFFPTLEDFFHRLAVFEDQIRYSFLGWVTCHPLPGNSQSVIDF